MKKLKLIVAGSLFTLFAGCASVSSPVGGYLFLDAKGPVTATGSEASGKTGKACAKSILGWVGLGDASIETAKKAGGIKNVGSVDHESTNILGLYATFCTVVTGN